MRRRAAKDAGQCLQNVADRRAEHNQVGLGHPVLKTRDALIDGVQTDRLFELFSTAPDADILPQPQASSAEIASLFAPFTFYLSRETPRASLEFILKAFGCKRVGWDGTLGDGAFTTNESDPNITHKIVDRPALSSGASNGDDEDAAAPKVAKMAASRHLDRRDLRTAMPALSSIRSNTMLAPQRTGQNLARPFVSAKCTSPIILA